MDGSSSTYIPLTTVTMDSLEVNVPPSTTVTTITQNIVESQLTNKYATSDDDLNELAALLNAWNLAEYFEFFVGRFFFIFIFAIVYFFTIFTSFAFLIFCFMC